MLIFFFHIQKRIRKGLLFDKKTDFNIKKKYRPREDLFSGILWQGVQLQFPLGSTEFTYTKLLKNLLKLQNVTNGF